MADAFEFKVGNKVVYPAHGVGQIVDEESQKVAGYEVKMFVIDFPKEKMTLRVPVGRAKASGLRVLSNDNEVEKAIEILKGRAKPGRGMWSRREQEYKNKINSGDIIYIAEVVRDLHKNVDDPDRSYSERVIYESALGRLAGEYAAVNGIALEEATSNIVKILKARKGKAANQDSPVDDMDDEQEFEAA